MNHRELENNSFTVNLTIFRPKSYQKIVHRVRVPLTIVDCEASSYSTFSKVESWLLHSTQETEDGDVAEKPGVDATPRTDQGTEQSSSGELVSPQGNQESDLSEKPEEVETTHQTGRVGLQASFVPPIISLFQEVTKS